MNFFNFPGWKESDYIIEPLAFTRKLNFYNNYKILWPLPKIGTWAFKYKNGCVIGQVTVVSQLSYEFYMLAKNWETQSNQTFLHYLTLAKMQLFPSIFKKIPAGLFHYSIFYGQNLLFSHLIIHRRLQTFALAGASGGERQKYGANLRIRGVWGHAPWEIFFW